MAEYKNAYFVPAHRTLEEDNLVDFLQEVRFALQSKKTPLPFILLDDTNDSLNRDKVASMQKEFSDIELYVINKIHIKQINDEISTELDTKQREIFKSVYPDHLVNYGNTMNKMFILGTLLGCESIHRRDSDILIDTIPGSFQKNYPIEIELDRLGRKINNKTVFVVGSGYKEMKNIDFQALLGNDLELFIEYLDCIDIPEKYQEEKIRNFLDNGENPCVIDPITENSNPECGNISFYRIFECLPCSPAPFTLGTDYFPKETVNQTNMRLVYHDRKVIHRHTQCRYDKDLKVYNYVWGVASYVDTMSFYSDFFLNMKSAIAADISFENDLLGLNLALVAYYREKIGRMDKHTPNRKQSFSRFIELLQKSSHESIRDAAAALLKRQEEIFQHTSDLLHGHVELLEAWPKIIKAAKMAGAHQDTQEILQKSRIRK